MLKPELAFVGSPAPQPGDIAPSLQRLASARHVSTLEALQAANRKFWAAGTHTFGDWEFRPATGEVLRAGAVVAALNEAEAETLNLLIRAYPLPVPRKNLVEEMRRVDCYWHIDTVKVVVARIRRKLGQTIVATHPRGYLFAPESWFCPPDSK